MGKERAPGAAAWCRRGWCQTTGCAGGRRHFIEGGSTFSPPSFPFPSPFFFPPLESFVGAWPSDDVAAAALPNGKNRQRRARPFSPSSLMRRETWLQRLGTQRLRQRARPRSTWSPQKRCYPCLSAHQRNSALCLMPPMHAQPPKVN